VEEVILPALVAGKSVISNRSWISMVAFQVYGRDRHDLGPLIESAIQVIYKDCPLDLAVILDISPQVGQARQRAAGKSPDVMESMTEEARLRIQKGFLETAHTQPAAKVIDASRPIGEVYKDIKVAVDGVLKS
jgi:thymidylate kinase